MAPCSTPLTSSPENTTHLTSLWALIQVGLNRLCICFETGDTFCKTFFCSLIQLEAQTAESHVANLTLVFFWKNDNLLVKEISQTMVAIFGN